MTPPRTRSLSSARRTIRSILTVATLLFSAEVSSATTIADLTGDFQAVSFPAGWQYLRNTGPIGDSALYTALLWDGTGSFAEYDVTGSGWPDGSDHTRLLSSGLMHPGIGTGQGAPFDAYFIAAYTIQPGEAGLVSLVNGSLTGNNAGGAGGASNGWDVRFFTADTPVGLPLLIPWALSAATFSQPLERPGRRRHRLRRGRSQHRRDKFIDNRR